MKFFKNIYRELGFLVLSVLFTQLAQAFVQEKPMVVIIPSYNNQSWCEKNILSVLAQNYSNFRIIFIDDCSTDHTFNLVNTIIDELNQQYRIMVIRNKQRVGALANLYNAIHLCADHEIIVIVDGDDQLAHEDVLKRLNDEYVDEAVWMTYGQFQFWPSGNIGYCQQLMPQDILNSTDRSYCHYVTHLRTFYAGLFKRIKLKDLLYNGKFYAVTWDKAMMAPMLEMAANNHYRFIPDVLYKYNFINPISDARIYGEQQHQLAQEIYSKPRYEPIEGLEIN